jgi:DNA-binding winged helix-turn-helix (wHTH) protein
MMVVYIVGDLTIDTDGFALRRRGVELAVEPRVLEFIIYLVRHSTRLISKRELIEKVWGHSHIVGSALSRCACLARKSLGDPSLIKTVHGRGYRWISPATTIALSQPVGVTPANDDRADDALPEPEVAAARTIGKP